MGYEIKPTISKVRLIPSPMNNMKFKVFKESPNNFKSGFVVLFLCKKAIAKMKAATDIKLLINPAILSAIWGALLGCE